MITALIMAGGQGTRFWPLSRTERPKQFLKLTDDQQTMLQQTVERINKLIPAEQIFIATNHRYKDPIREQLPAILPENIIIEPAQKDTAPAIGLTSLYIERKYPGAIVVVLPADHLIKDPERFIDIIKKTVMAAVIGKNILTIGINPTHPETGYGYIDYGDCTHTIDNDKIYRVKAFKEKPDRKKAEVFLQAGHYLWNSGMFIWQLNTIFEQIRIHLPDLSASLEQVKKVLGTAKEKEVMAQEFQQLAAVSIDYGIMEKAEDIYVIPGDFGWDDLGSWPALERIKKLDQDGNIIYGQHYGIDTKNSIIHSKDKVVTTIGLEDIVIVNTEDAVLICDKKRAQEVKEIREILQQDGLEKYL